MKVVLLIFFFLFSAKSSGSVDFPKSLVERGINLAGSDFRSLPKPQDFAFLLTEDEFEDYLEFYLQTKYQSERRDGGIVEPRAGCSIPISSGLSEPQPVYVTNGDLIFPSGTSGTFDFSASQVINVNCGTNYLSHSSSTQTTKEATLVCKSGTLFSGSEWLAKDVNFVDVKCTNHVYAVETATGSCANGGTYINITFPMSASTHTYIRSCFHQTNAESLFVEYDQTPETNIHQSDVDRPNFKQNSWFPGLSVETLYTQNNQKTAFDTILGSGMSSKYINSTYYLARGHLAAKADFVLSTTQRNTFTFINVAPQWQPFNGGNWNTLEMNLRSHIASSGIYAKIYTGTWDTLTLKDSSGVSRKIYLSPSNNKIPVPMWYYKVAYEPSTRRGTVFLGLNNPHVTLSEAKSLAFCTDVCANSSKFSWINWQNENIGLGYSLCCTVDDFRKTVNVLPSFTVDDLLY